jgi:hypothetical protein
MLNRTLRKFLRWRRTRFGEKGGGFREARGANVAHEARFSTSGCHDGGRRGDVARRTPPRVGEGSAARDDEDQGRQTSEPLRHAAICRRRTARGRGHFAFAAKRVVRAMLRATGLCLSAPTRVARQVVDRGFTPNDDYAVQTVSDVPYGKWRD